MSPNPRKARQLRHIRLRQKVSGSPARPRLAVFRSLRHIYAQVIDDSRSQTLAAASSLEAGVPTQGKGKTEIAALVGRRVAEKALAQGITQVAFDRGGYKYHGRVRALAEAAREAGLKF